MLAIPSWPVLEILSGCPIVECGAGDGTWLQMINSSGGNAIGYDPYPRGPNVMLGDHRNLHKHMDRVLLIVWPPDCENVGEWVRAWGGQMVALCGDIARFEPPELQVNFRCDLYGRKGTSRFLFGEVPADQEPRLVADPWPEQELR